MLNIIASPTDEPNPAFQRTPRAGNESNTTWLRRNLKKLAAEDGAKGLAYLVLLGGRLKADFRLRVAQGHLRHDMSPSHWSHVALLRGSGPTEKGALWEISLEPKGGFGYPPSDNGVQVGRLENYASKNQYPNLAVLRLPVKLADMKKVLKRFKRQRADIDCVELTLLWLGYVWGVGRGRKSVTRWLRDAVRGLHRGPGVGLPVRPHAGSRKPCQLPGSDLASGPLLARVP